MIFFEPRLHAILAHEDLAARKYWSRYCPRKGWWFGEGEVRQGEFDCACRLDEKGYIWNDLGRPRPVRVLRDGMTLDGEVYVAGQIVEQPGPDALAWARSERASKKGPVAEFVD